MFVTPFAINAEIEAEPKIKIKEGTILCKERKTIYFCRFVSAKWVKIYNQHHGWVCAKKQKMSLLQIQLLLFLKVKPNI